MKYAIHSNKNNDNKTEISIKAYDIFVSEIKREDDIISSRFSSFLALQGILLAASGFIISNGIANDVIHAETIITLRFFFLLVIAFAGFCSSLISCATLGASRRSLNRTREKRQADINLGLVTDIRILPPIGGAHPQTYRWASRFPGWSMGLFGMIWLAVIMALLLVAGPRMTEYSSKIWGYWEVPTRHLPSVDANASRENHLAMKH